MYLNSSCLVFYLTALEMPLHSSSSFTPSNSKLQITKEKYVHVRVCACVHLCMIEGEYFLSFVDLKKRGALKYMSYKILIKLSLMMRHQKAIPQRR